MLMICPNFRRVEGGGTYPVFGRPAVGMFFAELGGGHQSGNPTTGGDVTRRWKLPNEEPDAAISAYYCSVNYRKKVRLIGENNGRTGGV